MRILALPLDIAADGVGHGNADGLAGEDRINKIKCHKVARWVMDQYEVNHRLTAISDQEMEGKVRELMPEYVEKHKK